MAINTPSGWTQLFQINNGFDWSAVFYKVANGSEGASVNVELSGFGGSLSGAHNSYRITGHGGAPEVNTASGTGTGPNPPSLSPTWGADKTLWLTFAATFAFSSMGNPSYPSGYGGGISDQASASNFVFARASSAWRHNEAASDDPGAFTVSNTSRWDAATIGVRPG